MLFKIIYSPTGRALEYADFALNLYDGCGFGCEYCYVPKVLHRERIDFHHIVALRKALLEKAEHDAAQAAGKSVLLCFTCDPYQDIDEELQTTRKVMEIFNRYGVNWIVLTKGGIRAARDFDLYKPCDSFGCTLTFWRDKDSSIWEPRAALPESRLEALMQAKFRGIKTWVSMEPVIDPEQTLKLIVLTHEYVDLYKVGKLNSLNSTGSKRYEELRQIEKNTNWKDFGQKAEALLKQYDKQYYIKDDLRKEMEKC